MADNDFSQLGASKTDFFAVGELPVVAQELTKAAAQFVIRVQENLDRLGKISTGAISDGIAAGEIEYGKYSVSISVGYPETSPAVKYYDFVNEGVKGVVSGQPADSPYSFRKLSAPPVMVDAIYGWMQTNRIAARAEDQTRNLSALQTKRKRLADISQEDANRDLAYLIARSIKRKGLPYTGFVDEAVTFAFGQEFLDKIAKAIGQDVTIAIRQANRGGGS